MPSSPKASLIASRSPKNGLLIASKRVACTEAPEAMMCRIVSSAVDRPGVRRPVERRVDPDVDPRADRAVGVAVLQAREVPQLVRGDRWPRCAMKSALVAAGSPARPSRLLTLTEADVGGRDLEARGGQARRARDVRGRASRSRSTMPPSSPVERRVVEEDRGVRARRRRRLGERVRERGVVGGQLRPGSRRARPGCRRARRGSSACRSRAGRSG